MTKKLKTPIEDNFTLEDMENYMFLNKVGETYFIINFEA